MLAQAFDALKQFDFGTPLAEVSAIEDAVVAAHGDAAVRADLEQRLIAALKGDLSRDAKDYVCRKLAQVGSAAAVPALAGLLASEANAHLARHALERIPGPEAAAALRDALPKLSPTLKIGAISSLGARREASAVTVLKGFATDADASVARAATLALGTIGGHAAVRALQDTLQAGKGSQTALVDSLLSCAESLLAEQKSAEALAIYKLLSGDQQPRLVRLAATRGVLACASKLA